MPKKEPSQPCECRIGFETSKAQAKRIYWAAIGKRVSVAEWLRQIAETQLKRQKL